MRTRKAIAACFAGFMMTGLAAAWSADVAPPPNILFILTDDQGWPTLGCYGSKLVPTPHLDRLAAEGARFTAAYVMPQCTPTRAALLTGQHTARSGMWHVIPWYGTPQGRVHEPAFRENLSRETFTLAKGLKARGYATGMAGKWHLTTNADGDYVKLKAEAAEHYGFDFSAPPGPGSQNEGDKHVDYLTDQAIGFIERHRGQPWFFYLSHHTLHGRVSAPEALVAKYAAKGAPAEGPHNATYLAAIEHLDNAVGRLISRIDALGLRERTLVVFLSDNGGVDWVYDAAPFSSRQGARPPTPVRLTVLRREFSNAPLRAGKGSPYEGGVRVPCLVRWPAVVPHGTVIETPIHVVDWLPTLLEAAGQRADTPPARSASATLRAPAPGSHAQARERGQGRGPMSQVPLNGIPSGHTLDGASLVPLLRGESLAPRPLFWYLPLYDVRWGATPCAVLREGDWKLIDYFGDWVDSEGQYVPGARLELFNLREDLGETRNLASAESARATAMQTKLRDWIRALSAEVPGPNPRFDEARQLLETNQKPE